MNAESTVTDKFAIYNADCVETLRRLPANSIGYSVFSPPFASLYTYSNSPHDMGNVRTQQDFFAHFAFLVDELFRVMKPGRLVSVHCMDLPTSKERDGYIGIRDFRGDLIRAMTRPVAKPGEDAHPTLFINHSTVCIWKDPVTAMQRTHAKGLLYKELRKDSTSSRQGIPDYLVTFKKPGINDEPVTKDAATFPVALWQKYASPVWFDINPTKTLQHRSAREDDDERHICPLQLEVIERAVRLWSNPGDVVLSPFVGIGSEGYIALQEGRRFVGAELKAPYYQQAVKNLHAAAIPKQRSLFEDVPPDAA